MKKKNKLAAKDKSMVVASNRVVVIHHVAENHCDGVILLVAVSNRVVVSPRDAANPRDVVGPLIAIVAKINVVGPAVRHVANETEER